MALDDVSSSGNEQDLSKYKGDAGLVLRWLKELDLVNQSQGQQAFEAIGEKACKIYRNATGVDAYSKSGIPAACHVFNILWSTVQVLKPTYYWRMPKVVVERMHKDANPIGRLACQGAERCTSYMLKTQEDRFNYGVKSAVEDLLLPGRGQLWLRYDAEFEDSVDEYGQPLLDDEGHPVPVPKPNSEKVWVDYVPWKDYRESLSRNPYETRWRARRTYLTRAQLVKRFPHCGQAVTLNHNTGSKKQKFSPEEQEFLAQAEVWEIEDLDSKQTLWICEGYREAPLDVVKDRYKLSGFFCSPVPLLGTTTSDSTHPTAFFKLWEKLADELDYTLKRLSSLVECVRFVGATSKQFSQDVKNVLKLADGDLWPIDNWANWSEKGGLRGAIDWLPIEAAVAAIPVLREQAEYLLAKIYEITGIPDVIRGSTDPNEAMGTIKSKLRWVSIKTEDKQQDVQRFCRETISKMAEIIFEPGLFSDETIAAMAGVEQMSAEDQQNWPEALRILRNDRLRTFEVTIETDSTIAVDEAEDRADAMQYVQAVNQLLGNVESLKQFGPEFLSPAIETAMFAIRRFRTGRQLEGAWEGTLRQHEENTKQAMMNPPPPPPDYEAQKLELQAQKMQLDGQKAQGDFQLEQEKIQLEYAKLNATAQAEMADAQLEQFKFQFTQFIESQRLELDKYVKVSEEREKLIEEARLKAEDSATRRNGNGGGMNLVLKSDHPIQVENKRSKRRVSRITRLPNGQLHGESIDIHDDDPNTPVEQLVSQGRASVTSTVMGRGQDGSLVGESRESGT